MAKKKRRMPRHIVLHNGMWRFVKGTAKTAVTRHKAKRTKRRRFSMARKRHSRRSSRGGIVGRGSLMSGLIKPKGLIASALVGAGAATLAENAGIATMVPYGKYVAGGVVGGVGGLIGVFARDMIKGMNGSLPTASVGGYSSY
jgi:hypothetical protein